MQIESSIIIPYGIIIEKAQKILKRKLSFAEIEALTNTIIFMICSDSDDYLILEAIEKCKLDKVLNLPALMEKLGYSSSWIQKMVKDGKFPASKQFRSKQTVKGWLESEVNDWLEKQRR